MTASWTRRGLTLGVGAAALATPASAQIPDSIGSLFNRRNRNEASVQQIANAGQPGRQYFGPAGYTSRFAPVRDLLATGAVGQALEAYLSGTALSASTGEAEAGEDAGAAEGQGLNRKKDVFLRGVEAGSLQFDSGARADAVESFKMAEEHAARLEEARGALAKTKGFMKGGFNTVIGAALGKGDFGAYRHRDYEYVNAINYLSLAYLLQGDRRAYNVSRRSSVEQNRLQEKFAEEIEEARLKAEANEDTKRRSNFLMEALDPEFAQYKGVAARVPNAYVNPMGPYLSGVIQEIVSYEQPGLRSNAGIAYQQAASLRPGSLQLEQMTRAMGVAPDDTRILHVFVSEGLAPQPTDAALWLAAG